jgi:hypothetical protein
VASFIASARWPRTLGSLLDLMLQPDRLLFLGQALMYGAIFMAGSIVGIRRSQTFRRRWYWWLLSFSFADALIGPFVYLWITSYDVSLQDAILLRTFHAGWWHVPNGYSIFLGTGIAGLIGFVVLKRSKQR